MIHVGDITKLNGAAIEPVWCITGGSPCQDLSIAGKRAGLAGARSGLYMEQIRVVKEMRANDEKNGRANELVRPRYMVWENVPGAFSSNSGDDFRAVLEELVRIAEPDAVIPRPPKGRWRKAGAILGDGWSIAWRTHDAQYWGVPQRRRRIALIADFGGLTAAEILFERESLPGDIAAGGATGEGPAEAAESGAGRTGESIAYAYGETGAGYWQNGIQTLRAEGENRPSRPSNVVVCSTGNDQTIFCLQGNGIDRADTAGCNGKGRRENACYTLNTIDRPAVCAGFKLGNSEQARSIGYQEELSPTLNAECGGNKPAVVAPAVALDMTHACDVIRECGEQVPALQARMGTGGNQVPLTYQMNGFGDYRAAEVASSCKQRDFKDGTDLVCSSVDCRNFREGGEVNGTLQAKESGGQSLNLNNTDRQNMVVRRLTPMECERLQGFPDHWTDIGEWTDEKGKKHKDADSPRYKALGNSIALPFWGWMLRRMAQYLPEHATLGSLFDGIGGFPLCWEKIHGDYTARWASEIEEFPMAVTKKHFPE